MSNRINIFVLTFRSVGKAAVLFAGVAATSSLVFGQDTVLSCADIQDSDARLACYDEAAKQRQNMPVVRLPRNTTTSANEVVNSTSSGNSPVSRSDEFGLEVRNSNARSTERSYRVTAATRNDFTGWTIEFEGGGRWRQVGTEDYKIEVGETYTIRRGSLNSFLLSNANNNRKIRVKRIE